MDRKASQQRIAAQGLPAQGESSESSGFTIFENLG